MGSHWKNCFLGGQGGGITKKPIFMGGLSKKGIGQCANLKGDLEKKSYQSYFHESRINVDTENLICFTLALQGHNETDPF